VSLGLHRCIRTACKNIIEACDAYENLPKCTCCNKVLAEVNSPKKSGAHGWAFYSSVRKGR